MAPIKIDQCRWPVVMILWENDNGATGVQSMLLDIGTSVSLLSLEFEAPELTAESGILDSFNGKKSMTPLRGQIEFGIQDSPLHEEERFAIAKLR